MEMMTGRERIMTALRNGQPDRVPATPDISIMIPCRLTGKPSWEIEVNKNPSLTLAYINAVKYFGIDGWMFNGTLDYKLKSDVFSEKELIWQDDEKWVVRHIIHTPDGDLVQTQVSPCDNPSTMTEKMVKNSDDFKRSDLIRVVSYDASGIAAKSSDGRDGYDCVSPPGFQTSGLFNGNLEALHMHIKMRICSSLSS
jgi:hypothetical protein